MAEAVSEPRLRARKAALCEFTKPSWDTTPYALDTTRLGNLQFQVVTLAGAPTAYDFCVSGVAFLDASGNPVAAPSGGVGGGGGAGP